jgi:hypothetical protein
MIDERIIKRITRNLVDFGYPDLTEADVRTQVELIEEGAATPGDGLSIIGLFARTMLIENNIVKGE